MLENGPPGIDKVSAKVSAEPKANPTIEARGLAEPQIDPAFQTAADQVAKAWSMIRDGAPGEAAALLRETVSLAPDDVDARLALGEASLLAGERAEAVQAFQFLCDRHPEMPRPWLRLGETRLQLGDPVAAEAALRTSLALEENPHGYFLLRGAVEAQGRFDEGIAAARRMTVLQPHSATRRLQLGESQFRAGDPESAETSMRHAVELAPTEPRFRIELGQMLRQIGRNVEALAAFRSAADTAPDSAAVVATLAHNLAELGELAEAEEAWRRACALDPENQHFRWQLSLVGDRLEPKAT